MVRKHLQFALVFGSTLMATFAVFSVANAETATPAPTNPVSAVVTEALALPGRIAGGAFGATIGNAIVTLCGWLMVQASTLFSFLIEHIIVDFGTTLNTLGMTSGIDTVWTAFRDFGNILIIGMFTFVAIGTILGIEQYGARKMIARVLIVAILINFSLLFTKLAIDASNFVAHQFYKAASFSSVETGAGTGAAAANTVEKGGGIGALFLTKTGVGSVYSNIGTLGWAGLSQGFGFIVIYTFTISAFFLILAGIFLYGSLLIISRAFVLVILMITSAAALASSLVPAISSGKFSWKAWLDMLLKTSLFAPVLMIMLWGALVVLSTAPASSVSLADYVKDPTNPNAWTIIFMYMFTTGLLFIAIKAASSLSAGLPGLGIAGIASMLPFAFGARALGMLGRATVGRYGSKLAGGFEAASRIEKSPMWVRRLADYGAQGTRKATQRDFNLMNTSAGAGLLGVAGAKKIDLLTGKALKGFEGAQKESAKRLAETAGRMTVSNEDQKKMREEAVSAAMRGSAEYAQRHGNAENDKVTATKIIEDARKKQAEATEEMATNVRRLEEDVRKAVADHSAGDTSALTRKEVAERQIEERRAAHKSALAAEEANIAAAKKKIDQANVIQSGVVKDVERDLEAAGKIPKLYDAGKAKEKVVHERFSNALLRNLKKASGEPLSTPHNDALLKLAKKEFKNKARADKMKETGLLDAIKGLTKDEKDHAPKEKPADDHKEDDHH